MKMMHRIIYQGKVGFTILLLVVCSMFLGGCSGQKGEPESGYSEAGSMQVWNSTEGADKELVETKDEGSEQAGTDKEVEKAKEAGTDKEAEAARNREPVAGTRTLANLVLTAKQPLGSTMYIWGGGWNEEDTAAGEEARSIGVSSRWAEFAKEQDGTYNYNNTKYQIHDGLDCSGYVGWVIYNVFETEDGKEGYVMSSTAMAKNFAERGWGEYTDAGQVSDWQAGDIMSMKGHVWMTLGMCEDGSVVLMHASPPGVILCGTALSDGSRSQAISLAEQYMSTYYPEWYGKFPNCSRSNSYLTRSSSMRWSRDVLADEEGLADKSAGEVLEWLFGESQ